MSGLNVFAGSNLGNDPRATGCRKEALNENAGGLDAFVRKYDSFGQEVWTLLTASCANTTPKARSRGSDSSEPAEVP